MTEYQYTKPYLAAVIDMATGEQSVDENGAPVFAMASGVIRLSDRASIPPDPRNSDYAEFLRKLEADPTIVDTYAEPPTTVPGITKRQALLWLLTIGKTESDVLFAIDSISDAGARAAASITWNYPDGAFKRSDPLFDALGPLLGLTAPEQIDAAFRAAAQL